MHTVFSRKPSVRGKWWMSSSWLTQKWLTPNGSWKCRKLPLIRKWTQRYYLYSWDLILSWMLSTVKRESEVLMKTSTRSRKQRLSWRTSCRRPNSSRTSAWRRLKSRWCKGRSRSPSKRRRSFVLKRSSSPPWRDPPRQKPTRCSSWLRDGSEWLPLQTFPRHCLSVTVSVAANYVGTLYFINRKEACEKNPDGCPGLAL